MSRECSHLIPDPWPVTWSLKTKQNVSTTSAQSHTSHVADRCVSSPAGWAALSRYDCHQNPSQHSYCRSPSLRCTGSQRSPHGSKLSTCNENKQFTGLLQHRTLQLLMYPHVIVVFVDLRPAEYVDGARGGFVLKQFNVRNGLRHLERVLLLQALLLFFWLFKHHHHGVWQVL